MMYVFVSDTDISIRKLKSYHIGEVGDACLWLDMGTLNLYSKYVGYSSYFWGLWCGKAYFDVLEDVYGIAELRFNNDKVVLDVTSLKLIMGVD